MSMNTITITETTTGQELIDAICSNLPTDNQETPETDNYIIGKGCEYALNELGFDIPIWEILFDNQEGPIVKFVSAAILNAFFDDPRDNNAKRVTTPMIGKALRAKGCFSPDKLAIDFLTDLQKGANLEIVLVLDQMEQMEKDAAKEAAMNMDDDE